MFGRKKDLDAVRHEIVVSTAYRIGMNGGLSEDLWQMRCTTCGWASTSGFLHTAQHAVREHLGLEVDWNSDEIEVIGRAEE